MTTTTSTEYIVVSSDGKALGRDHLNLNPDQVWVDPESPHVHRWPDRASAQQYVDDSVTPWALKVEEVPSAATNPTPTDPASDLDPGVAAMLEALGQVPARNPEWEAQLETGPSVYYAWPVDGKIHTGSLEDYADWVLLAELTAVDVGGPVTRLTIDPTLADEIVTEQIDLEKTSAAVGDWATITLTDPGTGATATYETISG